MSLWSCAEARYRSDYTPPERLKVLISGLTRGGTVYVSEVLNKLCIPAGHERLFTTSGPNNYNRNYDSLSVDVSGLSAPWARNCKEAGVMVVHLLRDPVKCVNSNVNFFKAKGPEQEVNWKQACEYYLRWHQMIEDVEDTRIYLERLPEGLSPILELFGGRPAEKVMEALGTAKRTQRSTASPVNGTWETLTPELQSYALSHGYS